MPNAEQEGRSTDNGRSVARTILNNVAESEGMRRRTALATTRAAPMQSTTETRTASSPVSWKSRSQWPVASKTCSPIQRVTSTAASSVPMVTRTVAHHSMVVAMVFRTANMCKVDAC